VLAEAGLLDGRRCTTHWSCLDRLRKNYPRTEPVGNRIFCSDDDVYTSAGVATGIDLALSLVEDDHGALVASQVAKALVVYLRRTGHHTQESVYLAFRDHDHPGVHRVQNWIAENPAESLSLDRLAAHAGMSRRSLTRHFKRATGLSVGQYLRRVRIALAQHLMRNPDMTLEAIAAACGYDDPRQFRAVWKTASRETPSVSRRAT